jgi:hypothetical protein
MSLKPKVGGAEKMFKYDTYIDTLADQPEGEEIKLLVRDFNTGETTVCL